MPDADIQRFEHDLAVALSIIRQRRAWIMRDLTHKDRLKAEHARRELIAEIMKVVARYDVNFIAKTILAPSTP